MLKDLIPEYINNSCNAGYLVGGAIRDLLIGRQPTDFDIVVQGNPDFIASQLASAMQGHSFKLGRDPWPLYRVVHSKGTIDITAIKGDCIEKDLHQRDFTINAMAFDLARQTLIDPLKGVDDLDGGLVRMVSRHSFSQDPARLIRAYRMAANFNFSMEPKTSRSIAKHAGLIKDTPGERIWPELQAILLTPNSTNQIDAMKTSGLLAVLFPGTTWHRNDDGRHRLNTLAGLEKIFREPEAHLPEAALNFINTMTEMDRILSKMALLLHDLSRTCPYVTERVPPISGGSDVNRHPNKILTICRRLRTSTRERNWITLVTGHHPYPMLLFQHPQEVNPGHFFKLCGHHAPYILILNLAEVLISEKKESKEFIEMKKRFNDLIKYYFNKIEALLDEPPLINGRELMDAMSLESSPLIGEMITILEEARLESKIQNKDQAMELAKRFMNTHR